VVGIATRKGRLLAKAGARLRAGRAPIISAELREAAWRRITVSYLSESIKLAILMIV